MKQQYTAIYDSPLGEIVLAACEDGLTGLWFAGQKYFGSTLNGTEKPWQDDLQASAPAVSEIFARTRQWLDIYFSGKNPDFTPPLALEGSPFRLLIWNLLLEIPYGHDLRGACPESGTETGAHLHVRPGSRKRRRA